MIPKVIHYCWFGGKPLPKGAIKCIESWKKYLPDYEIIEWNESNFNIYLNQYTKRCYEQKKYAFLSDYVRLYVVEKYGGIYLDTDVEVVKSFDDILTFDLFIGYENHDYVNTGQGFGSIKNGDVVKLMLNEYEQILDNKKEYVTCPKLNTRALREYGFSINGELQLINNNLLLPKDYFNPFNNNTGVLNKTANTYSIHWYSMSWLSSTIRLRSKITRLLHRFLGEDFFHRKG